MVSFSKVQLHLQKIAKQHFGYNPFPRFHLLNKAFTEGILEANFCGKREFQRANRTDECDGLTCIQINDYHTKCWRYDWFHNQEFWLPCEWLRLDEAFYILLNEDKFQHSLGYQMYRVTPPVMKGSSRDQKSLWEQFDMGFNPERLPTTPAPREEIVVSRIIRDTPATKVLKELYKGHCQVCGLTLQINGKNYCEAHHLRPLGHPHDGPDTVDNMLVLCPNCHVYFDYFAAHWLGDDKMEVNGQIFTLTLYHMIAPKHIEYYQQQKAQIDNQANPNSIIKEEL